MRESFQKIGCSEKTHGWNLRKELKQKGGNPFKIWRKSVPGRKSSITALKERCVWNVLRTASGWNEGDSNRRWRRKEQGREDNGALGPRVGNYKILDFTLNDMESLWKILNIQSIWFKSFILVSVRQADMV